MAKKIDFYLSSGDSDELNQHPRACRVVRELRTSAGQLALLVEVSPPLQGEIYSRRSQDLQFVAVTARFEGDSVEEGHGWPLIVYVLELPDELPEHTRELTGHSSIAAWGELYSSLDSALAQTFSWNRKRSDEPR